MWATKSNVLKKQCYVQNLGKLSKMFFYQPLISHNNDV
jgi:hypothetical protein